MFGSLLERVNCFAKAQPSVAGEEASSETGGQQFRVVFVLGGPGSGKGTMCARIVEKYGWVHLSAGDLLRAERKDPTSKDGELINEFIKEGKIVPVEITLKLLQKAMDKSGAADFLVDGFPRNLDNYDGWVANMAHVDVPSLLYLETSEEVMQDRILRRAEDAVNSGNATRSDDNVDSIKKRFKTYLDSTMPIIDTFKQLDKVHLVDSTPEPDVVFDGVSQLFDKLTIATLSPPPKELES
mmetsp:Transcript_12668/g.41509  ORF Transcript_12668/g.41509 Transcript_12668/m.41509 type:complete len:240 (-) Transcript_12668:230-949(-)